MITITDARIPVKVSIDETKIYQCHNVLRFEEGDTHDIVITRIFEDDDGYGPFCELYYEYAGREFKMAMISVDRITRIIGEDRIKEYTTE